ncbi:transporter [Persicirhabdus sediminis]|uniref:Transporter n=1 Tax=Persicirhabdus sediminis TaxID=454144 RepID=A0A8J7MHI9_9BACT|nr:transporter [Persicirhabdus sediminis]MBK1792034.1 transporter [Persicirhabdus sediminis]
MKQFSLITTTIIATAASSFAGETVSQVAKESSCATHCPCGTHARPDYHAPIGVMADHVHNKGTLMASYRYMYMSMQRSYDGSSQISDSEVLENYMMTPTDMDMQMHMIGLMYSLTDSFTLGLMANYKDSEMNMTMRGMMGMPATTSSSSVSGVGDTTISALYQAYAEKNARLVLGLGLSMPTGSIDETLDNGLHVPYTMQLGSGTWDIKPTATWVQLYDKWSYGAQLTATIRTGSNDNGYDLGNRAEGSLWAAYLVNEKTSISTRLIASSWGNVNGESQDMAPPSMTPATDTHLRGGQRLDLALGVNYMLPINRARLALEIGGPVYQDLDGPQLGSEWFTTLGIKKSW